MHFKLHQSLFLSSIVSCAKPFLQVSGNDYLPPRMRPLKSRGWEARLSFRWPVIEAERDSDGAACFLLGLDFGMVGVEDIHRSPLHDRHRDTGNDPLPLTPFVEPGVVVYLVGSEAGPGLREYGKRLLELDSVAVSVGSGLVTIKMPKIKPVSV